MATTELESIIARLKANTSDMKQGFEDMVRDARTSAKQISDSFESAGKRVQSVGKSLVTSVTAPLTALTVFSVKAASDVDELMNLIRVTFGDSADAVIQWSAVTADAINRSRFAMIQAAGDFAAFLKPLGVAPEHIDQMSMALSQLVTDISSFRNMTENEVMTRLFSGMAGETEAVRRLGIDIGATAVEAELLSLGFEGNFQTATQAQKAVARYNLIMRQTADAQGDALRTSESFENQWRGMLATVRDIRIAIGQQFMPTATRLVATLRQAGQRFLGLSAEGQKAILMFGGIAAAVGPGLIILGGLVRIIGFAIGGLNMLAGVGIKTVATFGRAMIALGRGAFIAVRTVATAMATLPGIVAASVAAGVAAVMLFPETLRQIFSINALNAIFDTFSVSFYNKVVAPAKIMMNDLIEAMNVLPGIDIELLELPGQRQINDQTRVFVDNLASTFTAELERVKGQLSGAMAGISDSVMGMLPESLKSALDEITNIDFDLDDALGTDDAGQNLSEVEQQMRSLFQTLSSFGSTAGGVLDDTRFKAQDLADDLRQAFVGRLADIRSMGDAMSAVLDRLKAQILEIVFFGADGRSGLFGGAFNSIAGTVAGIFGGARAAGGPVESGKTYLVGEKGPELFTPGSSGQVHSNSAMNRAAQSWGNVTVYQNFNFPPDNAELNERMVSIGIAMRDQAIGAMREARNQGF